MKKKTPLASRRVDASVDEVNATCFVEEACEGELQVGGQAVSGNETTGQGLCHQRDEGRLLPACGLPVSLLLASHPLHLEQQVVHLGVFPAGNR